VLGMPSYWELLLICLPVFVLIGIGTGLRQVGWLTEEADASLLKLVVNFLYPALIFETVLGNSRAMSAQNLLLAPAVGFVTMAVGIGIALWVGRLAGLSTGHGLRTFAFGVGLYNYGYIPIPVLERIFGADSLGVLLVHNVGCEAAIWTVGILVLSGLSLREGWRKLLNPPVVSLAAAVALNLLGWAEAIPEVVTRVVHLCGACAIPLGLLLIGATLREYMGRPSQLVSLRVSPLAIFLRLGLLPLTILGLGAVLPCPDELKHVMIVQAAMPAGVLPIVIAKHYGGQPHVAVQVVIGTTLVALFTIPLWIRLGLGWLF
jgi:malate permease and related proteins